jgi:two-component system, LytTR family, sensor kinase
MLPQRSITGLYHLLFWSGVALLWFYLRYQDYTSLGEAAVVTLVKVMDLAAAIYIANLILVPRLLYRKKYVLFAVAFITLIAAASFLKLVILSQLLPANHTLELSGIKEKVYNNFVTQFFLVLASIGLKSVVDYLQLQKTLAEVAKERAEAELIFLKSQINPHFLFNSLNAVYFLIDKKNAAARNALHTFSDMLRYQLYECNDKKIPIEKEIGYLKDYVGLQQLRLSEHTAIQFRCGPDVQHFAIEPLLLLPFVENSFKHLSHYSNGKQNQVQISISKEQEALHFSVRNTTEELPVATERKGIGLLNVKKRLELLYPAKHLLTIGKEDNWFSVNLQLALH